MVLPDSSDGFVDERLQFGRRHVANLLRASVMVWSSARHLTAASLIRVVDVASLTEPPTPSSAPIRKRVRSMPASSVRQVRKSAHRRRLAAGPGAKDARQTV